MEEARVLSGRFASREPAAGLVVVEFDSPPLKIVACEELDERVCGLVRGLGGPVLVAYSRASPARLAALQAAGAAACLPLGFSVREALERFLPAAVPDGIPAGEVRLTDCGLAVGAAEFRLPPAEYRVAQALWAAEGRTVGHAELERALYGRSGPSERAAVRQAVYRLRARRGPLGRLVETVPGFGYRLAVQLPGPDEIVMQAL
jgi:DNA-binding response OmpR family regulator